MNTEDKKAKIKSLVTDLLNTAHEEMIKNIDKALNSGAVDVDDWDENFKPMILPKIIYTAIVIKASKDYEGKGTSYEKWVKKEVNNLLYFI